MDPIADLLQDAHAGRPLLLLIRYDGLLAGRDAADEQALAALLRRLTRTAGRRVHLLAASPAAPPAWAADANVQWHAADAGLTSAGADVPGFLTTLRSAAPEARLVVIGCSDVDERLFAQVRAPDVTARVGSGATHADARLEDGGTVRGLLGALV